MNGERQLIRVHMHKNGEHAKIVWHKEEHELHYEVLYQPLDDAAYGVRKALKDLIETFRCPGPAQYRKEMKALIKAGQKLYHALFDNERDDSIEQDVREHLLAQGQEQFRLCCDVAASLHIPWGLVHEPDFDEHQPEDRWVEGFWCFKHTLWGRYRVNEHASSQLRVKPQASDIFTIVPLIHKEQYEQASGLLSPEEIRVLDPLWSRQLPCTSVAEFKTRWAELGHMSGLLYFYGHAASSKLALSDDDVLSVEDLKRLIRTQRGRSRDNAWIAFLNGCDSAAAPLGAFGFLQATHQIGFHGFVGTEVAVPDLYALRFGMAVLAALVSTEQGILQIMDHLRRTHAPLSMAYGVYCDPHFQVVGSKEPALGWPPAGQNFSTLRAVSEYK